MFGIIEDYNKLYVYKVVRNNKIDCTIVFNPNPNYLEAGIIFDRFVTDIETHYPIYITDVSNINRLRIYVNRFGKPKKGLPFSYISTQKKVVCKIKSLKKRGII